MTETIKTNSWLSSPACTSGEGKKVFLKHLSAQNGMDTVHLTQSDDGDALRVCAACDERDECAQTHIKAEAEHLRSIAKEKTGEDLSLVNVAYHVVGGLTATLRQHKAYLAQLPSSRKPPSFSEYTAAELREMKETQAASLFGLTPPELNAVLMTLPESELRGHRNNCKHSSEAVRTLREAVLTAAEEGRDVHYSELVDLLIEQNSLEVTRTQRARTQSNMARGQREATERDAATAFVSTKMRDFAETKALHGALERMSCSEGCGKRVIRVNDLQCLRAYLARKPM